MFKIFEHSLMPAPDRFGTDRTCESCRYWLAESAPIGTCKLYPPIVYSRTTTVVENHAVRSMGDYAQALPQMHANDWCGQHSRGT